MLSARPLLQMCRNLKSAMRTFGGMEPFGGAFGETGVSGGGPAIR